MKSTGKIILKLMILICFLLVTPFFKGIHIWLKQQGFLNMFVYHQQNFKETISIKDQLNLMSYNGNLTIGEELTFETTQDVTNSSQKKDSSTEESIQKTEKPLAIKKRVYIYNTHQSEAYADQKTVMDAAAILGNELEKKGIDVVLETADFNKYLKDRKLDYEHSYKASHSFLMDALVAYGGFDLIIDLHRDAIPKEASFVEKDGVVYAKLMPVVGGLGKNKDKVTKTAAEISNVMNQKVAGIMRPTMTREAYYNQEVHENTILMECGGDVNTFDEVKNSMKVFAEGIYDFLVR